MLSRRQLAVLFFSSILLVTRGQDDDDQDFQTVDAFDQDRVGNEAEDTAVTGVMYDGALFVGINTMSFLDADHVGEDGTTDIVIRSFDPDDLDQDLGEQYGGDMDDAVRAIAGNIDVMINLVIVGSTESEEEHLFDLDTPTGEMDWFIATVDPDSLVIQNAYVNGTSTNDQEATAVAIASDGGFVVAGWTWGPYFDTNAGADNDDDSVGYDAWVLKINEDLDADLEWGIQFGTVAYDVPSNMVIDSDDYVYVIGTTLDNSNVLTDSEEEEIQSMFVYKIDSSDGDIIWSVTTELGFMSDSSAAYGVVLSESESELYVSGNTQGIIGDFEGDTTDTDELFLVSLDVDDGDINWVWQSEANASAFGTGGVVLSEDGFPIVGGIAFGNQFNLTYEYWEGGSGDMIAAKIDTDELEVVKYFNAPAASNLTREQPWAMVKDEDVEDGVILIGYEDGDFEDEDVEPDDDDTNYLILKVELEEIPETDDDDDSSWDFPYWYIGLPVFAIGIILFICAYKCAESSQKALEKKSTMI